MNKFCPKMYKKNIYEINYNKLRENGIKCLVFDLDNTIALIDQKKIDGKCKSLFKELKKDFNIFILSNNKKRKRVEYYAKELNTDYIFFAKKPFKFSIKKIMNKYQLKTNQIAVIGDQLVTDMLFANRCKTYSILVDPMGVKDLKITGLNRKIEKFILKQYKKKGLFNKGEYYE